MNEFQENDSFVVKIEKGENLMAADINGFSYVFSLLTWQNIGFITNIEIRRFH